MLPAAASKQQAVVTVQVSLSHAMQAQKGIRGIILLIPNLSTRRGGRLTP